LELGEGRRIEAGEIRGAAAEVGAMPCTEFFERREYGASVPVQTSLLGIDFLV
jgi:hypothetical protein